MFFRFNNFESAFACVAVAATASLAIATESDVAFGGSTPTSKGNTSRVYSPRKISDKHVNGFVRKEGEELLLNLENHNIKEKTTTGTTRQLRNNRELSIDDGNSDSNSNSEMRIDQSIIDIGVLKNMGSSDAKVGRHLELSDYDYCYNLCGPIQDRIELPAGTGNGMMIAAVQAYCENYGTCGDCYGDGDDIDRRCPSMIQCRDTSKVTNMAYFFAGYSQTYKIFNEPLRCWDVSSVTDMKGMFFKSTFNQPIDNWDVSSVSNMYDMFEYARAFNQPLDSWNVASVTDMYQMFSAAAVFNQPLDSWDISSVTNIEGIFWFANNFNGEIGSWDVSSITNMTLMLSNTQKFNQDLSNWDVSSVENMKAIFAGSGFNQDIGNWNVSSVNDFTYAFFETSAFNQPLDSWDVSSVVGQGFDKMFLKAEAFNQCISSWSARTNGALFYQTFAQSGCPEPENLSCQGSEQQCYATTCTDDENFRFKGEDSQDCEWVASNTTIRCAKDGVFEGCAKTCNPLCFGGCSNNRDFRLNGVETKSCEWVAKQKTSERCKKPGIMDACPQTCNPLCTTTELDCTNDEDFRLGGLKGKNCEWVAKQKTDKRCMKPGVMTSCPQTCNPACVCTDSTNEFEFLGSTITCEDIDVSDCDAEPIISENFNNDQLTQLQSLFDILLDEKLEPIYQKLDAEKDDRKLSVEDGKTFNELCPKKCNNCPGS